MRTLMFCITRGRFELASLSDPAPPAIVAVCRLTCCHRRFRSELATRTAVQRTGGFDDHTRRARSVLCVVCVLCIISFRCGLCGLGLVKIIIVGSIIIVIVSAARDAALSAHCARGSRALGADSARAVGCGRLLSRQGFGYRVFESQQKHESKHRKQTMAY
jgi:hypothetical protein